MEETKETYYQKHRLHLNEQRLLQYYSKGLDKSFIKKYVKEHGQKATIEMIKDVKKKAKNIIFAEMSKGILFEGLNKELS
jgi:hypothetical protein